MGFAEWLNEFLYVDQRQEIKAAEDQRKWYQFLHDHPDRRSIMVRSVALALDLNNFLILKIIKKAFYGRMSCS